MTLKVEFKIPNFDCIVNIDIYKLSQVIRNLISNGLKFCQKPGHVFVGVDVVPISTYHDIINISNKKKKRNQCLEFNDTIKECMSRNKYEAAKAGLSTPNNNNNNNNNNEDLKNFLRISVKDDGAGISEVRFLLFIYFIFIIYLFIVMSLSCENSLYI